MAAARRHGGIEHGALLDLRHTTGDTNDNARAGYGHQRLLVGLANEILQHGLGDLKLGDNAIAQGANGDDVGRRSPDHLARFCTDSQRPAASLLNRHPGRLVDHDAATAHAYQGVGGSQVNADVEGEKAE